METAFVVAPEIGLAGACRALGVSRATAYRHRNPRVASPARPRRHPPSALSDEERSAVAAIAGPAATPIRRPTATSEISSRRVMMMPSKTTGRSRQWLGAVPATMVWAARQCLP